MPMPLGLWNMVDATRLDMSELIAVREDSLNDLGRFRLRR
jgi:hypothetical protein